MFNVFNKSQADTERDAQIQEGRNMSQASDEPTVHRKRRIEVGDKPHSKPAQAYNNKEGFQAKGHDAVLKAAQDRGANVSFELTTGKVYSGVIFARDRYTVSVKENPRDKQARIIYKHVIASFKVEDAAHV
jgi:sRNA-binding regulator protein Hfq